LGGGVAGGGGINNRRKVLKMMLYNKQRVLVDNYRRGDPTNCPDCGGELVAKRGGIVSWHWAHKANTTGCSCGETEWHLICKSALMRVEGWDVEVPVTTNTPVLLTDERTIAVHPNRDYRKDWRLDAYHSGSGSVVEFVNSNSETYSYKHAALTDFTEPISIPINRVYWVFNALFEETLQSKKLRFVSTDGLGELLKPLAFQTVLQIDRISGVYRGGPVKSPCFAVVFTRNNVALFRHWVGNVWYPTGNRIAPELQPIVTALSEYADKIVYGDEKRTVA